MPVLRRRSRDEDEGGDGPAPGVPASVPWALGELLREGPAPLVPREARSGRLDVALVLGPGQVDARALRLPPGLLPALAAESVDVRTVTAEQADEESDALAAADVVLAAGWPAAPAVLRASGLRARALLATTAAAPLAELGWATGLAVLGPAWMGGALPPGADKAYVPMPVHRREDLVLVHGDEPFGLLAAAELARRRDDLTFAVSGVRSDLELPFPFHGVESGPEALAHAFASAGVAFAPPVRGWRPAAIAMLACGQAVVAPDDGPTRTAIGAAASLVAHPVVAAAAAEELLVDIALRAERARAGFAAVPGGWSATAAALAESLRALP